jgi:hypothetical protein
LFEREFSTVMTSEYNEVWITGLATCADIVMIAESDSEYQAPEPALKKMTSSESKSKFLTK